MKSLGKTFNRIGLVCALASISLATFACGKAKKYEIVWKNSDGTTIKTEKVSKGDLPVYEGETPTKEADATYSYTFTGWSPEVVVATSDATYTATFSQVSKEYTIIFENEDHTVLQTSKLGYGDTPVFNGTTPEKASTDEFNYEFNGWTPNIEAVKGNATYRATYSESTRYYVITWNNEDGTTIKKDRVAYGETPVFSGIEPAKEATAEYTYNFSGWTPAITTVNGDATYTAEFSPTTNTYYVEIAINDNNSGSVSTLGVNAPYGTAISTDGNKLIIGDVKTVIATPMENNEMFTYEFVNWTGLVETVTESTTITANFNKTYVEYEIVFENEDHTVLQRSNYHYNDVPEYNGDPLTKDETPACTYEFAGWSPQIEVVTASKTYTAVFTPTTKTFRVTISVNDDTYGFVDQSIVESVPYGTEVTTDGEVLFIGDIVIVATASVQTNKYEYAFASWNNCPQAILGDIDIEAAFTQTLRKFTLSFNVNESEYGSVSSTTIYNVDYGTFIVEEDNKIHIGNVTITATPTNPTAEYSYIFLGWTGYDNKVTCDCTITAGFERVVNYYTITFAVNESTWGSVMPDGMSLPYGMTVTTDGNYLVFGEDNYVTPIPASKIAEYTYSFNNWTNIPEKITGDVTITANFTRTINSYTIRFMNGDDVLQSYYLEYGSTPEYTDETPYKEDDENYSYEFNGWSPAISTVKSDTDYVAQYISHNLNPFTDSGIYEDGAWEGYMWVTFGNTNVKWIIVGGNENNDTTKLGIGATIHGENDDLGENEILLVSEGTLGSSIYANLRGVSIGWDSSSPNSFLKDNVGSWGLNSVANDIQAKTIYSAKSGGSISPSFRDLKLFTFAEGIGSENFVIDTYLNSTEKRYVNSDYWLRTGGADSVETGFMGTQRYVSTSGISTKLYDNDAGIRPCFVLKLYEPAE